MDEDRKFIEQLAGESLREQRARRRWGVFFRMLFFAYIGFVTGVLLFGEPDADGGGKSEPHAAVVEINGVIAAGGENDSMKIGKILREVFEEESAKGVILQINSPGGSPVESNRIYRELRRLREKYPDKKVYAVAGDVCASGGYYIAAGADEIYVDENSIVGSIGAILSGFGFSQAMEKLGVERRVVASGGNKNFLDPFLPRDLGDTARASRLINAVHENFAAAVREGRGERLADHPEIFSGAVFSGGRGVDLGLADGVGDSGFVAREKIGVEEVVYYTGKRDIIDTLIDRLGVKISAMLATPVWR